MNVHELLGRMTEHFENEKTQHSRTISVLEMLKSGAASLDKLEVVREETGSVRWTLELPEAAAESD